jgi:hypothetical protein
MNREINRLENLKKGEIKSLSDCKWLDQPFPEWENFLTLDYWKDYRTKILSFQTEKELDFYAERLRSISYAIRCYEKDGDTSSTNLFQFHYSREKHEIMKGMDPIEMIKQEELRLQNISWEDWQNEYKFSPKYLKINELSTGEMLDDPWFNEQINNLFGLKNENLPKTKKKEQQERDTSAFQFSKITGELTIFSSEINFNKFYQKKIDQYQTGVDYNVNEEKIISVHNVYNIFSNQLKKDIFLSIQQDGFFSDTDVGNVRSIRIIVKEYADYQREEGDKWHEEVNEKFFKNEVVERKLEKPFNYESWSEEKLVKEIERLTSFIDRVRNNDESLTQAQRENSGLVIQNLEKHLSQSRDALNNIITHNNNNNNPLPIAPIIGGIGLISLLGGLIVYKLKSNKIKK